MVAILFLADGVRVAVEIPDRGAEVAITEIWVLHDHGTVFEVGDHDGIQRLGVRRLDQAGVGVEQLTRMAPDVDAVRQWIIGGRRRPCGQWPREHAERFAGLYPLRAPEDGLHAERVRLGLTDLIFS